MEAPSLPTDVMDHLGQENTGLQEAEQPLFQARAAFEGAPTQNNWSALLSAVQDFVTALQRHVEHSAPAETSAAMQANHAQLSSAAQRVVESVGNASVDASQVATLDADLDEVFRLLRQHDEASANEAYDAWWKHPG